MPKFLQGSQIIQERKKVWLIRDPRDAVVSLYFSESYSHPLPKQGKFKGMFQKRRNMALSTDIDSYVLKKSKAVLFDWNSYLNISNFNDNLKVFRYEDVIFNKYQWVKDICSYIGLELPEANLKTIADKHDIVPEQENVHQHIRKVVPGDHKEKLDKQTIEELNVIFQPILEQYGYLQDISD